MNSTRHPDSKNRLRYSTECLCLHLRTRANKKRRAKRMENKEKRRKIAQRNLCFCGTVAIIVGFIIGILIGRFATCPEGKDAREGVFLKGVSKRIIEDSDPHISAEIIDSIKAENIRTYLRELTENPHVAGTPADWEQADELRNFWLDNGLDEVFISEYDVLLSRPNVSSKSVMNRVQIVDGSENVVYESPLYEKTLHPSENRSGVLPPFNAYSAAGIVESDELIYVNYGRYEDYVYLENLSPTVNVSGKIVIARYGKIFRGDKVKMAQKYGAIGIILYSDPDDYADGQTNSSSVYPNDWWLPTSGVQRGSLVLAGDPLTPGYPAIETAYREKETDIYLPKIPCHPISSGTAAKILAEMTGNIVSDEWKGAIPNIVYKHGGKLSNTSWKVKLKISTENYRAKTYNAFGMIKGSVEPDRYVLLGNHRDSWVFGAVDPSSATAVLKEVSRVMGQLVKSGKWRPRRSIIFCSWGAEEYGLIGSYEWVEQYIKNLAERSIAYLNVDLAIEGNYSFKLKSTPLLYNTVFSATKKVPNPNQGDGYDTVYDRWKRVVPAEPSNPSSLPKVHAIGSGSDYAPMIQLVGLPSCGFRFTWNREKYKLSSYPLYHSKYETFNVVDNVMDKGFRHHRAVGQVWAEVARDLADTTIIPLDVMNFAREVKKLVDVLKKDFGDILRKNGIKFDDIERVSTNLKTEATVFTKMIKNVNLNNPLAVRQVNDQLMLFERAFIDPQGLPSRPNARHILFADSSTNTYAGSSFPGLVDALFEIEKDSNQEQRWKVVRKHFSVILFTIDSAISTIRDVTKFIPEFEKSK